ncbi:hypothetical protein L596_015273 [Steinernema carpocapsae]|uniref:Uncharacterized protein n=1 Tax=Steinernema carpocapsae TaxID=34508 RepID=A0A4U5NFT0_STECR|nr:hypothetical protein L596_015273 [Steinernema carpocapsae]
MLIYFFENTVYSLCNKRHNAAEADLETLERSPSSGTRGAALGTVGHRRLRRHRSVHFGKETLQLQAEGHEEPLGKVPLEVRRTAELLGQKAIEEKVFGHRERVPLGCRIRRKLVRLEPRRAVRVNPNKYFLFCCRRRQHDSVCFL